MDTYSKAIKVADSFKSKWEEASWWGGAEVRKTDEGFSVVILFSSDIRPKELPETSVEISGVNIRFEELVNPDA